MQDKQIFITITALAYSQPVIMKERERKQNIFYKWASQVHQEPKLTSTSSKIGIAGVPLLESTAVQFTFQEKKSSKKT